MFSMAGTGIRIALRTQRLWDWGFDSLYEHQGIMTRKEYCRNYQREWIRKRREKYFVDKTCAKCGSKQQLELHHKDPHVKITHRILELVFKTSEYRIREM